MSAVSIAVGSVLALRACWSLFNLTVPHFYWWLLVPNGELFKETALIIRWSEAESIGIFCAAFEAYMTFRPGCSYLLLGLAAMLGLRSIYFGFVAHSQALMTIDICCAAILYAGYMHHNNSEPDRILPITTWSELVLVYLQFLFKWVLTCWNIPLRSGFGLEDDNELQTFIIWQSNMFCAALLALYHLGLPENCFVLSGIHTVVCFMKVAMYNRPISVEPLDIWIINFIASCVSGLASLLVVLLDLYLHYVRRY